VSDPSPPHHRRSDPPKGMERLKEALKAVLRVPKETIDNSHGEADKSEGPR